MTVRSHGTTATSLRPPGPEAVEPRASAKLKRQVLLGVVEANVETLAGLPTGESRRRRERRRARLRRVLVAAGWATAVIVAVALSVAAWRGLGPDGSGAHATTRDTNVFSGDPASVFAPIPRDLPRPLEPAVIPLAIRTIAVDAGHGGGDGGTSLAYGLVEKELTLDIALRLEDLLVAGGCEVVMTRRDDRAVSLKERAAIANEANADLFVSIHVNWLPNRHSRGVETYFAGPTDDPFLEQLAAAENRDSGFSMADYRTLLDGVYAGVRQSESRLLADGIQNALTSLLKRSNPDIMARGVMRAPFVVLVATEMPSALAEVACLSNDREARLLGLPSYRQEIALALRDGIRTYAERLNPNGASQGKDTHS